MRLAHLSDLHLGLSPERDALIVRRFEELAALRPDHLVISGDLSQHGREAEWSALRTLLQQYGWYDPARLTVIPGNHDLFSFFFEDFHSGSDLYAQWRRLPRTARGIYRYGWEEYHQDLERFHQAFAGFSRDHLTLQETGAAPFPFIKLMQENVALIAIESNRLLPQLRSNTACSKGWIDLESTARILGHPALQNRTRILLLHHHLMPERLVAQHKGRRFATMTRIVNRAELVELLGSFRIDLVLHGHYHEHEVYQIGAAIPVVNSGGFGRWHLIEIKNASITIHSRESE
ncbi:MAG TPA: metallophosphoesterase [bacterium]|nr:metallophosphoesterase [bacterium]HPR87481.1 metallophosphoesterase [bacterium]